MKDDEQIIQTTLRIPRGTLRQLKIQAAKHDRSVQQYLLAVIHANLISELLEEKGERFGGTQKVARRELRKRLKEGQA